MTDVGSLEGKLDAHRGEDSLRELQQGVCAVLVVTAAHKQSMWRVGLSTLPLMSDRESQVIRRLGGASTGNVQSFVTFWHQ